MTKRNSNGFLIMALLVVCAGTAAGQSPPIGPQHFPPLELPEPPHPAFRPRPGPKTVSVADLEGNKYSYKAGTPLEVHLKSREKVRGRFAATSERGIVLQVLAGDHIEEQELNFNSIRSVKNLEMPRQGLMIASGLTGLVIGLGAFVVGMIALF